MSYSFNQHKKINKSIRAAEEHSHITPIVKKRLEDAEVVIKEELTMIRKLLKKPVLGSGSTKDKPMPESVGWDTATIVVSG